MYLFVGSLFPGMDFGQLAKLGNVLEHYTKHRAEGPPSVSAVASFVDFIWTHFIKPAAHDGQHPGNDHQELPFQSISSASIFAICYSCRPAETHKPALAEDIAFHYAGLLPSEVAHSFFHPPAFWGQASLFSTDRA